MATLTTLPRPRQEAVLNRRKDEKKLSSLRNVGPKFLEDLRLLGVSSVATLARRNPMKLYRGLEKKTGARQDPCVLDTFKAIVHEARTGEARDWWTFTAERKRALNAGRL